MKYRKKPVVIEAMRWMGNNTREVALWVDPDLEPLAMPEDWWISQRHDGEIASLVIPTLEGDHHAQVGDWIIRGVAGEYYPCKPEIFEKTYEAVA